MAFACVLALLAAGGTALAAAPTELLTNPGFEEWAGEYGYDSDSRKAERIYRAIAQVHHNVIRLLGDDWAEIANLDEDELRHRCA